MGVKMRRRMSECFGVESTIFPSSLTVFQRTNFKRGKQAVHLVGCLFRVSYGPEDNERNWVCGMSEDERPFISSKKMINAKTVGEAVSSVEVMSGNNRVDSCRS